MQTHPSSRASRWSAPILSALLVLGVCAAAGAAERLLPVSIVLHWKHQAQWSGFYMAKEKGLYAKRGLDVTILERQGRSDPLDLMLDGRTTFATHFLSGGVGLRSTKQPIALIGQVFNRSNLMIIARRSAGVDKFTDLSGKPVCFWDGYYRFVFRALFRRQGVKELVERPMGLTVTQFTSKQVVACSAMEYNEYNLIRNLSDMDKDDLAVFRLRDMDMDFPEDAIYTSTAFARDNPQVCRDFVAATIEGWEYARANPDETIAVVMRYAANDPEELVTEEHQRWMLKICGDSVFAPDGVSRKVGRLSRKDFDVMKTFLKENGQFWNDYSYDEFVLFDAVDNP